VPKPATEYAMYRHLDETSLSAGTIGTTGNFSMEVKMIRGILNTCTAVIGKILIISAGKQKNHT
jgi:hypothetical protein